MRCGFSYSTARFGPRSTRSIVLVGFLGRLASRTISVSAEK